jgi:hypothetical protein
MEEHTAEGHLESGDNKVCGGWPVDRAKVNDETHHFVHLR